MGKKYTINDIARMAGTCIGTVSRVINNKDKVHPDTRQRIREIIEKTGYRPSAIARGLVLSRTHNILLCLHNIADPYCAAVAKVIGARARKAGYGLLLADTNYDPALETEYLQRVGDGKTDGLIVAPLPPTPKSTRRFAELARSGFPVVAIDCTVPGVPLNSVKYDDVEIARIATDYLLEKGHRRIGFLQFQPEFATVKDRYRGYLESHHAHGVATEDSLLMTISSALAQWDATLLAKLFERAKSPTAVVAENEITATLCVNTLMRLGKRVPADVAVVSLGDLLSEAVVPLPMTAVSFHHEEAMRRALDLLVQLIDEPELRKGPPCQYVQQPELIVRESA
jgi:DNA-binding LacI/PurR family transcriptional regulator